MEILTLNKPVDQANYMTKGYCQAMLDLQFINFQITHFCPFSVIYIL